MSPKDLEKRVEIEIISAFDFRNLARFFLGRRVEIERRLSKETGASKMRNEIAAPTVLAALRFDCPEALSFFIRQTTIASQQFECNP